METAPTAEAHLPPGATPGLLAICVRGPCPFLDRERVINTRMHVRTRVRGLP